MSIVRSFIKNTSGVRTPPVAPSNSSAPTIDDTTPIVGQTLTASPGTWAGSPLPSFSYQWQADTGGNGTFANISGATAQTFVVTSDQSGDDIRVVVTATNAAGSASANSSETSAVAAQDTTPSAFAFTDATAQELSTLIESDAITVAGINWPAAISVTGGEYQKNGGAWTSSPGTVANGDTVKVRHTTSGSQGTNTDTVLTIGGVSDTFRSTTKDTVPAAFSFTDATNADRSTVYESDAITVSGITAAAAISVAGGEYQIGAGAWTSSPGTVTNGQSVKVRGTSSGSFSTAVDVVLTIGGVSDTFRITTLAQDTTPTAFSFTDVTDADLSTVYVAGPITVAGINDAAAISITGGEYRVNGGSWTSSPGTVDVDDEVEVRGTSSDSYETAVNVALTIGGVSDTFTITTAAEVTTPALVWSSDMNIDNDDVQTTAVVIDAHKKGIFNLVGVMVASGKRTGAPAMRAILDAYGLEDVPIGVKTTLTQADYDFYPTAVRDLFGKTGETDAAYPDAATLYRQLAVDNPGMYIATGGALTCESAFLNSSGDGISALTGAELITAQEIKLFVVGGRIGLTSNEPNFDDDRAAANNVCENWPENIVFGAIPSDVSTIMAPVRVRVDESRALNPARLAFSRGSQTLNGFLGNITLNDPSGDINGYRNSGDTIVIEEIIDVIQGNAGASFGRTATGKMIAHPTLQQHTFSSGTSPNRHVCITSRAITQEAQGTKIQGWLDALAGPARVNLWKSSTSLYGASDNSAVLADGTGAAPDGTTTACTVTGGGWAGHVLTNIRSFPSQAYTYVAYMKKTTGKTRFPAMTIVFKNSTGSTFGDLIAEAGAVINTNTGVGYAATGGSVPAYGSHACTVTVAEAPSSLGANYADWWEVKVTFTTPANTAYLNIYIQSVAGNNATSYTRDGLGASGTVTVWGMGLYPEGSYGGYIPTVDRAVFEQAA